MSFINTPFIVYKENSSNCTKAASSGRRLRKYPTWLQRLFLLTSNTHHSQLNRSLQLLLGPDVAGSATFALATVGRSWVEAGIASTTQVITAVMQTAQHKYKLLSQKASFFLEKIHRCRKLNETSSKPLQNQHCVVFLCIKIFLYYRPKSNRQFYMTCTLQS